MHITRLHSKNQSLRRAYLPISLSRFFRACGRESNRSGSLRTRPAKWLHPSRAISTIYDRFLWSSTRMIEMPHVELLSDGKVPVVRQASILWFLVSLHGAVCRRLVSLSALSSDAGLLELSSQMWREADIVTQLLSVMPRFSPMFMNPVLLWSWEAGWLPSSAALAAGAPGLL